MPITVAKTLHTTVEHTPFPGVAAVAITTPGPLSVAATQDHPAKCIKLTPTVTATLGAYVGFNIMGDVAAGAQPTCVKDTIVDGFAGVSPASLVFVAGDGTLTHTAGGRAIGIGVRESAIYFYAAPVGAVVA